MCVCVLVCRCVRYTLELQQCQVYEKECFSFHYSVKKITAVLKMPHSLMRSLSLIKKI